ncbi:MAG TPA: hypothetical protein PLZ75_01925 [Bacteroidales bacterium]|nr:hypothetical protein [Bacteroidales bacterium]
MKESDPTMNPTGNRPGIDDHSIVIFGAGRIGRSFIGQLFGRSGYRLVFIDADPVLVGRLNAAGCYRVIMKGEKEEEIVVSNLEAIHAADTVHAAGAVSSAGILAVSVGMNAIEKVVPSVAAGIDLRHRLNPRAPLDIILAENMRSAAGFVRDGLRKHLPPDFPVDTYTGLIETSIGKMVPIMPVSELEKDPLLIFAEPYNTLILDAAAFKNPVPGVAGLAPVNNIRAWVDRKAFIHNLGHATAAYFGNYLFPEAVYMHEVLDHQEVRKFTREVMLQSADIIKATYPDEFTLQDLVDHTDDLILRFRNKALGDTIFRVGRDLPRKLAADDRFMGAVHLAARFGMPCDKIIKAMSFGFFFSAKDEAGNSYQPDIDFRKAVQENPGTAMLNILGLDLPGDSAVIKQLKEYLAAG